ncbi:MAG: hemolysin III family protein [Chloroflexi bacterium]|nr:hemolysin III family protein [Chloroflexota bacterium]MBI1854836.1 hemolysin III family protein [Chloroflexota bacterium]MBI3339756.1 hemolysin III family protein [Chloroflexota bacterium]
MINKLREPVNGLTHFFAAIIAAVGLIALIVIGWNSLVKEVSLSIYGASLILLFAASAAYHMVKAGPKVIAVFRKLDHAAIYLLIAGTYTPISAIMFTGFWKWGLLAIVWSLAVIGIVVKMFIIKAPRWITAGVYLVMGWLSLAAIGEMLRVLPVGALVWLITGGVIYTLGAIVYITKKLDFVPGVFGFHEVWHIFVILAALAHFIAIAVYIAPAIYK